MRLFLISILILLSGKLEAQELSNSELVKLIPDRIEGYRKTESSRVSQLKIGNLSYSICQKSFSSGSKEITILLFDFKNAPIMYNQVTREWSAYHAVDSDSLLLQPVVASNYSGWESNNHTIKASKIFLGISNRFYMAIDGRNVVLDDLRNIMKMISLDMFPE